MSQVEVNRGVSPEPRKPGRWTWAVVGRLCSRTFVAVTLLWLVALVGWPEQNWSCIPCQLAMGRSWRQVVMPPGMTTFSGGGRPTHVVESDGTRVWTCDCSRDGSLRVLWEVLFPPEPDVVFLRMISRGPLSGGKGRLSFSGRVAADD